MKKRLLIVVDYQNDFVDGALGFEKAKELEPYLVNLIEEYKKNNDDIIYTMDTHQENYLQTEEGKYIPVVHCIRGTKGHELYGDKLINDLKRIIGNVTIKDDKEEARRCIS